MKDLVFDWDDLEERKARLTIHSSDLGDAVLSKDGENLYYLTQFEKGLNLWTTNLRTKETKELAPTRCRLWQFDVGQKAGKSLLVERWKHFQSGPRKRKNDSNQNQRRHGIG